MKQVSFIALIILVSYSCENKSLFKKINTESVQKINTEAVTKFWNITDILKEDKTLNDSLWNSYYNLTGNRKYMENNRSEQNITDHRGFLELFFRPSFSDSLNLLLKSGEFDNNDIFQNLKYIKNNENKLRDYTQTIISPEYFNYCINLAKEYLPKNKHEKIPKDLNIYLETFTYDAAVQGNNMYFGLSVVHDFDKFRKGAVVAHELHHVLRVNKALKNILSKRDSASYSIIDKVNNEGIADLIDKELLLNHSNKILLGPLFKEAILDNVEDVITNLDSCFIINSKKGIDFIDKNEFQIITSYLNGHVPGYYMAYIIQKNGKLQELLDKSDNPFSIFYIYNRVAENDKNKPTKYSDTTIEYLKELEIKAYK